MSDERGAVGRGGRASSPSPASARRCSRTSAPSPRTCSSTSAWRARSASPARCSSPGGSSGRPSGLEPLEITGLVEHRDATLHGIREGMVAVDLAGTVTLVNDVARSLLRLPHDAVGRHVADLGLAAGRRGAARAGGHGHRRAGGGRRPRPGAQPHADPLARPAHRLGDDAARPHRAAPPAARARRRVRRDADPAGAGPRVQQPAAHHLRPHRDRRVRRGRRLRRPDRPAATPSSRTTVTSRIADPAVAALLLAKASLADERGVELRIVARLRAPAPSTTSCPTTSRPWSATSSTTPSTPSPAAPDGDGWVEVEVVEDGRRRGHRRRRRLRSRASPPDVAGAPVRARRVDQGARARAAAASACRSCAWSAPGAAASVEVRADGPTRFVATLPARVPAAAPAR